MKNIKRFIKYISITTVLAAAGIVHAQTSAPTPNPVPQNTAQPSGYYGCGAPNCPWANGGAPHQGGYYNHAGNSNWHNNQGNYASQEQSRGYRHHGRRGQGHWQNNGYGYRGGCGNPYR